MSYPTDYADEQALTDFLSQNRDGFINVAQTSGSRDVPYQMEVTAEQFRSGQPPHGTQSVMLKVFEDLGGPRPSTSFKGFNYDLGRGQPITFDNLFVSGSKPLDAIYPIVQREVGQNGSGAADSARTGLDPAHYQNFAITDEAVIFYFAPGELLPTSAGVSQARVPRSALPPLTRAALEARRPHLRRETVNLADAGGDHHPAIGCHRYPDRIAGGRRQRIAVDRAAVCRDRRPAATTRGRPVRGPLATV